MRRNASDETRVFSISTALLCSVNASERRNNPRNSVVRRGQRRWAQTLGLTIGDFRFGLLSPHFAERLTRVDLQLRPEAAQYSRFPGKDITVAADSVASFGLSGRPSRIVAENAEHLTFPSVHTNPHHRIGGPSGRPPDWARCNFPLIATRRVEKSRTCNILNDLKASAEPNFNFSDQQSVRWNPHAL
jgi:hypothetical protein